MAGRINAAVMSWATPPGRWITFLDRSRNWRHFIAPFQGETPAPEEAWIQFPGGLYY